MGGNEEEKAHFYAWDQSIKLWLGLGSIKVPWTWTDKFCYDT